MSNISYLFAVLPALSLGLLFYSYETVPIVAIVSTISCGIWMRLNPDKWSFRRLSKGHFSEIIMAIFFSICTIGFMCLFLREKAHDNKELSFMYFLLTQADSLKGLLFIFSYVVTTGIMMELFCRVTLMEFLSERWPRRANTIAILITLFIVQEMIGKVMFCASIINLGVYVKNRNLILILLINVIYQITALISLKFFIWNP